MPLKSPSETPLELNLTPMIDVLFLLIIFFMVGAKFTEDVRDIELQLPAVGALTPVTATPQEHVISVERDGAIQLDGTSLDQPGLERALRDLTSREPHVRLSIWGDAGTEFQHVADVLAVCKVAGIRDMAVSVQLGKQR